jgi:hypothetical protein
VINLIKDKELYFLNIGHDFISNSPKRVIPLSSDEVTEMANSFNEEFAVAIGKNEMQWSYNDFTLTDAPEHPYGWTDLRKRTIFHYKEQSWHMIPSEIAEIGRLAKRALNIDV